MTSAEKRTILLNSIFNFGSSLVANFVSVYLFIYTGSIPMMCLYTIVRIGLYPGFFSLGYKISRKHSFATTFIFGLSMITFALVFALLGGPLFEKNAYYVLIDAVIIGAGEGLYWFSANNMNQHVSSIETRAVFFSYNGIFTNISSVLSPIFASFILSLNPDEMIGYRRMLTSIIIVFIMVIVIAFSLHIKSSEQGDNLSSSFSLKDKTWRGHNLAIAFYGLRNGLELGTLNLFIYNVAKNGNTYSKLQIVYAIILIVTYRLIIRFLDKDKIKRTFKIGTFFKISAVCILVLYPTIYGAVIYGVIQSLSTVFYDNSLNVLSANIIGKYRDDMTSRIVVKESFLTIGRCVAMAFIILCSKVLPESYYLQVSLILLSFGALIGERIILRQRVE